MQKVQKNAVNTKHKQINFSIERPFSSNKQLIHQEMWTQISQQLVLEHVAVQRCNVKEVTESVLVQLACPRCKENKTDGVHKA